MGLLSALRSKTKKRPAGKPLPSTSRPEAHLVPQQPSSRRNLEHVNTDIGALHAGLEALSIAPRTNFITFDKNRRNGTGAIVLDTGNDLRVTVVFNENKKHENQPSHRIMRTTELNNLHEIGALWERVSKRGETYYFVKMSHYQFTGFLWADNESRTAWRLVRD
ncbi:hypothetical protein MauCBS54593_000043 [Microsporum audouinii]